MLESPIRQDTPWGRWRLPIYAQVMAHPFAQKIRRLAARFGVLTGVIAVLVLAMLVLAGVFQPKVSSERFVPGPSSQSDHFEIAEVRLIRRPRTETAVGTVRAVHEAAVASKLLARVVEVLIMAGQSVTQGDILIRLDDADLQARVKQMDSAEIAAQARFEQATLERKRAEQLINTRAISQSDFDQAIARHKTAEAELRRTQQALEEARVLLEFATLRAPLTGIVIDKRVQPGDTATPGQVLVTLYEPNHMQLVATVRESLALRLQVGDQIPARLDALDHRCLAKVSEIVPQAEAASRSFQVKVTGPCPPGVYSGMFGRISIPLDDEEVLVVPTAAVLQVGQLDLVEVIQDSRASRRMVQLGRVSPQGYEVLSGLREGEKVVLRKASEGAHEKSSAK